MEEILSQLKRIIESFAYKRIDSSFLDKIAPAVNELSYDFTAGRQDWNKWNRYMNSEQLLLAYLVYYLPPNLCKIFQICRQNQTIIEKMINKKGVLTVLDIGCGPGSATLGLLFYLLKRRQGELRTIELWLLDSSAPAMYAAKRMVNLFVQQTGFVPQLNINCVKGTLDNFRQKKGFDLILAADILNEIFLQRGWTEQIKGEFCNRLRTDGILFLLEPSLRSTGRQFLKLRDHLLKDRTFYPLAPCLATLSCPALDNPKDWCHHAHDWPRPDFIAYIDNKIGRCKDVLKYSYLLACRGEAVQRLMSGKLEGEAWRVVSSLMEEKGKFSLFMCGRHGRFKFTLLKKEINNSNAPFCSLQRYDLVSISRYEKKGKEMRLYNNSEVRGSLRK